MFRKLVVISVILFWCFSSAFASVGIKEEGSMEGSATDIDIVGGAANTFDGSTKVIDISQVDDLLETGDVTFRTYLLSVGRISASSSLSSSSTTVGSSNVPYCSIRKFLGAGVEATTLPNGYAGQMLRIQVVQSAGGVWTITPTTSQIITSLTMTAVKDSVTLVYWNDTLGWGALSQSGSAVINYNVNRQ